MDFGEPFRFAPAVQPRPSAPPRMRPTLRKNVSGQLLYLAIPFRTSRSEGTGNVFFFFFILIYILMEKK
jgi:hypothetical protein